MTTDFPLYIGARRSSGSYGWFGGVIDEVKISTGDTYSLDEDVYIHGKHSWHVTGNSY